ncbi:PaaI family thioesterase [Methanoculleus sp.]|uniref:PaaI family thioesterase n=1 Tax=Methanoculleus sp. TaxID=90427 RepID=UPI0025D2611C|nr:PaaI family thioesterase [Methanoculleus sp.]
MKAKRSIPESYAGVVHRSDTCEFARRLGMVVTEIAGGSVRVAMPTAGMENAHGTTHGGAIFALADHAFGIAGNMDGVDQTGLSGHIRYFSPPAGETLEAVARRVSETERVSVYAVDVYSGDRLVASLEGVGFKTGVAAKRG